MLCNNKKIIDELARIDILSSLEEKLIAAIEKIVCEILIEQKHEFTDILEATIKYVITGSVAMHLKWFCHENNMTFQTLCKLNVELVQKNLETATNND